MKYASDILQKIDELKMMVMMDEGAKTKDEYLYDEWVDTKMGRKHVLGGIFTLSQWAELSTINSMVQDLFYKKHAGSYEYEKLKPEIMRIIKQVVSMTLFYKEQYGGK